MKVTTETDGPCRQIMHVDIPAEVVQTTFDTGSRQFAREAKLPGFRPGRAPRPLVERRYAQPIAEQVRDRLLSEYYRQAIEQEQIEPVHVIDIKPDQPEPGQDMSFQVIVDVAPSFQLPDYRSIEITDETAPVTDAEVDEAVKNVMQRHAAYPEVDRPAREGDLICFDYDGAIEDGSLEEIAGDCRELCSGRDVTMPMMRERELFPGFFEALQGVAKDEERRVEVVFPEDHPLKTAAGKTVVYPVRVKTVREEQLPQLDQEFFDKIGVKDEEELRRMLRTQMEQASTENEQRRRRDTVIRYLLDHAQIEELPQSLLEEENRMALQNMVQDFTRQGVTKEKIEENREDILRAVERTAQERVKLHLILDRIADQENISVSEEEFSRHVAGMASAYRLKEAEILKIIKKRNATEQLAAQLRRSKTTAHLFGMARITPGNAGDAAESTTKEDTATS